MKYALRMLWYIVKLALVVLLMVGVLVVAFFTAMDSANVYIITSSGLEARAAVQLGIDAADELNSFYSAAFLFDSENYTNSAYDGCVIRDYKYDLKITSLWCQPWSGTATVSVVEDVPQIDGDMITDEKDEDGNTITLDAPQWQRMSYTVKLVKSDSRWVINEITEQVELEPAPTPTDEPEITVGPTPTATPTPLPGEQPVPTPTAEIIKTGSVNTHGDALAVNVRSGPSTAHSLLGTLPDGTQVNIIEKSSGWYKILFGNDVGWIYGQYIDEN